MAKFSEPSRGDVFQIPLQDSYFALGRIVENIGELLYVTIFNNKLKNSETYEIANLDIEFATLTTDAKFYHNHWPIIKNDLKGLEKIHKPFFKVHEFEKDCYFIESLDKSIYELASAEDVELYHNRFSVSPKRLEKAVDSYFNGREWDHRFDKLKYQDVVERSKFKS